MNIASRKNLSHGQRNEDSDIQLPFRLLIDFGCSSNTEKVDVIKIQSKIQNHVSSCDLDREVEVQNVWESGDLIEEIL